MYPRHFMVFGLSVLLALAVPGSCNRTFEGEVPETAIVLQDQKSGTGDASTESTPVSRPGPGDRALPVEKRAAFMAGHVQAGLALMRANAPDQAAPHLMHPVSETHVDERVGLAALGFDEAIFRNIAQNLDAGYKSGAIETQLLAAEANIALVRENAGGEPVDIVAFLVDKAAEEYMVGVNNEVITDPGEYQDAYGFVVVALDEARRIQHPRANDLMKELEGLLALWPGDGPLAGSVPTPGSQFMMHVSRVRTVLDHMDQKTGS